MWYFEGLVLVAVWYIFFSVNKTVKDIDSKEFLWKITKASKKLMSKDPTLATMGFSFMFRNWSAVLECKDGIIVVTLNRKFKIKPEREALEYLGVGVVRSKGQSPFYWYKNNLTVFSDKEARNFRWTGPTKSYLLKNNDQMLPGDVLTLFIRLSTFPSPIITMDESRQSYCMHYHGGDEEYKFDTGKDSERLCLDCKVLKNLSQNLKGLYLEDKDPDVKIIVRNKTLRAHRLILKARSPVLTSMLSKGMTEIKEDDCDSKVFGIFLQFLYSGTVDNMDTNNVISVYNIAYKYKVLELLEICVNYMVSKLTVHSVSNVIGVALKHKDFKLLVHATDFFIRHAAEKIFPTAEWQAFLEENPTKANEIIIESYSYKRS